MFTIFEYRARSQRRKEKIGKGEEGSLFIPYDIDTDHIYWCRYLYWHCIALVLVLAMQSLNLLSLENQNCPKTTDRPTYQRKGVWSLLSVCLSSVSSASSAPVTDP